MDYRSETPPFNLDKSTLTDVRDIWIGSERAAELIGVGRTQVWRLASQKWAPMQAEGETPPVRVVVMGTEDRPEYKFLLSDVLTFARERRCRKTSKRLKQAQKNLRKLLPLLRRANPNMRVPVIATPPRSTGGRA